MQLSVEERVKVLKVYLDRFFVHVPKEFRMRHDELLTTESVYLEGSKQDMYRYVAMYLLKEPARWVYRTVYENLDYYLDQERRHVDVETPILIMENLPNAAPNKYVPELVMQIVEERANVKHLRTVFIATAPFPALKDRLKVVSFGNVAKGEIL